MFSSFFIKLPQLHSDENWWNCVWWKCDENEVYVLIWNICAIIITLIAYDETWWVLNLVEIEFNMFLLKNQVYRNSPAPPQCHQPPAAIKSAQTYSSAHCFCHCRSQMRPGILIETIPAIPDECDVVITTSQPPFRVIVVTMAVVATSPQWSSSLWQPSELLSSLRLWPLPRSSLHCKRIQHGPITYMQVLPAGSRHYTCSCHHNAITTMQPSPHV